jgi:hypothetical protein
MEMHERINLLLKEKNLSKKEFAIKLRAFRAKIK